jgi:hypothetical protein
MDSGLFDGRFSEELNKLTPEQLKEVAAIMEQRSQHVMNGWKKSHGA